MCDHELTLLSAGSSKLPQPARIRHVQQENARVKTFVLETHVEAAPGQFVMLWMPGVNEKPFSIADNDPLTLSVAQVGPFTAALHRLRPGDWLWWRGPYGRGFALPNTNAPADKPTGSLLLVAGGYGAAPLAFLAKHAVAAGWPVTAVLGARCADDLILADRMANLGCDVCLCTEDGSCGERGLATQAADAIMQLAGASSAGSQNAPIRCVYGCGPQGMLDALRGLCTQQHLACQLSHEALIKCGLGVCGSCAQHGLLVCKDGPVFTWSADGKASLRSEL